MRAHLRPLLLVAGFILVQKPADWDDPSDPPIERWKQVKRFESYEACEDYRNEALIAGAEVRSQAMLAQADSFRCVQDPVQAPKASPSTTTTAP